jgi:hypothetical protein
MATLCDHAERRYRSIEQGSYSAVARILSNKLRLALCDNHNMELEVECYAGCKPDERPIRFRIDGHDYLVEEVLDQWYRQDDVFYKVRADDGNLYVLGQDASRPEGIWHLVSFRQLPR